MLEYVPFVTRRYWSANKRATKSLVLCNWAGKIGDLNYSLMNKDGIFLRNGDTFWLKNDIFTHDIVFTGTKSWINSDTTFDIHIPALGVYCFITGNRFGDVLTRCKIVNRIMSGVDFTFGRRGQTCFIEFP